MRPLRLELKGFTAFRDPQTIEFDGLELFAISGPTGSGKTSILDAMTYALYGYIERVGKQAGQFVSQGQTRMAVTLDFEVHDQRYRVTRTTPTSGGTRVLLQRWDGADWKQAGEGADRVRDVNEIIKEAVGLDYNAFTRTVLLPQGRFAEFLVGDAKERRDILTDLLGLELFERLARRAGELRREADAEVRAKASLLETEYAGVSPEALADAEAAAKEAGERDEALAEAEGSVRAIAERWADTARAVRDLAACASDAREAAAAAAAAAAALEDLAARSAEADAHVRERTKTLAEAERATARAEKARAKAEAAWGRATVLARLRAKAEGLGEARASREEAEDELAAMRKEQPRLDAAARTAEERLQACVTGAQAGIEALEAATAALDEAKHADLVAAVRAGITVGDACPICGARVEMLPKTAMSVPLARAEAALEEARRVATSAREALTEAQRAADAASAEVEAAAREAARHERDLAKIAREVEALERELAEAMGGRLPADPLVEVDRRIERVETLEVDAREAAEGLAAARAGLTDVERDRDGVVALVEQERVRLEALPLTSLRDRAMSIAGEGLSLPDVPEAEAGASPGALAASADVIAAALEGLAGGLDAIAESRSAGEVAVVREAAVELDRLVDVAGATRIDDLVDAVSLASTRAARAAAASEERAELLRTRLANAAVIVSEVVEQRVRANRFDALAKELRADRLIAFLQVEALQLLAAAGSRRLSTLSSGRYLLEFDEDEFYAVDTWNGDERRSARTLSGGETFLASLALALALAEQVRSLAVTERARLDSLFLDEGFGTLDRDSLEVVVDAIEQLGGDGRMVGVITHVQELAIRLPARIEVEKSPRGSRLRVVA